MSAPAIGPTCSTCVFFKRVETGIVSSGPASQVGECRARPPLPIVHPQHGTGSAWPVLAGSGWCGEHRRPDYFGEPAGGPS